VPKDNIVAIELSENAGYAGIIAAEWRHGAQRAVVLFSKVRLQGEASP